MSTSASSSTTRRSTALPATFDLAGRVLLVVLFLVSGFGKLAAYSATAGYMASAGVPPVMLPLVIALEIGGSIAIILGWQTRVVAFLLAGFTLLTALLFHTNLGDQMQQLMFMKNLAITGAFLLLVANGAGRFSLDARKRT
ncbi:putative oxidoreductase [Pseudoxanthomonas sp. GM95]|uniref:DoxX family protein n=1 Tax=Pseudoxanthomonas sp. GM95 TaxID=1881043 RepID=UPI0008D5472A|nr:DoxX family protein [Pseudoxanthomonas sp. GM95]SEM52175.1 putative oxidoreductase [Pseudoxanthomonas sp. GM95]